MTTRETLAPRRLAMPAAALIGALALAGCSSGNIGETWQCPLAETGSCDSVAAADPAVPAATGGTVLGEPLWRQRAGEPGSPVPAPCEAECSGGFDPFAWLARLFGAEASEGEARSAGEPARAPSAAAAQPPDPGSGEEAAAPAAARTGKPATAALPDESDSPQDDPARNDPAADDLRKDDLRTGEVVARIWIAPFVDADGVYREASHVRVVLEPAGWRLP